jgi:pyruvate kinase
MGEEFPTFRCVRIVATIGPASRKDEIIRKMIQAGMNVARLNFSHGSYEDHAASIQIIRREAERLKVPIAILQDLQGVKIRTGVLKDGSVTLQTGHKLVLTARDVPGDDKEVSVSWKTLPQDVHPGDRLLLDDGRLGLKVSSVSGPDILTELEQGGTRSPPGRTRIN